jgi:hypothetical protein
MTHHHMITRFGGLAVALAAFVTVSAPAFAKELAKALTRAEVEQAFIGNTIISAPLSRFTFREFHALTGQIYGSNGSKNNTDACWRWSNDKLCYNYPVGEACYDIMKLNHRYIFVLDGKLFHEATVRSGNPFRLTGRPARWSCPTSETVSRLPVN